MTVDRREFLTLAAAQAGLLLTGVGGVGGAGCATTATGGAGGVVRGPGIGRPPRDVVVIGAGAFGGWTAWYLHQLGARVTLVDAYGPGNSRATSGDETRGVRSSYGDRELWIRWANEAIARWKAWDEEWYDRLRLRLYFTTGDLILRPEPEPWLTDTLRIWAQLRVPHEVLSLDEVARRYPQISLEGMSLAAFETNAGVVRARRVCETVAEMLRAKGGQIVIARAEPGARSGGRLQDLVLSTGERLGGQAFVFACGPWMAKVLPEVLTDRLRTPLGQVFYFGTPASDQRFVYPHLPSWNVPGVTGWPALPPDHRGFRVRTGGGRRRTPTPAATDPDASERWVPPESVEQAVDFVCQRFPALEHAPLLETRACHYELSVNRNFIVDRHPELENVWIAGAGNAEGFKFGPVIGEYVARRVLGKETDPTLVEQFKLPQEIFEPTSSGFREEEEQTFGAPL
ncbi:MAG: NAD(P)/FAD-dependent oxidoreductase [Gemmatimonadales bacterium]